ncbi:hypothetical protein [Candidatus Amarolinea aalborgensis]|jgi:hypothetical protein|uniref:hypothetical protein n=1 Tax=Candidatus Amarolinea aalborgensis TaxID=2249329 RepID=UPI003BF98FD4
MDNSHPSEADEMTPAVSEPAAEAEESDPGAWLFALTPEAFGQLSASYAELHESDADSPLAGLLAAWLQIERSKQSLMELFA